MGPGALAHRAAEKRPPGNAACDRGEQSPALSDLPEHSCLAASSAHRRAVCFTHSLASPPCCPLLQLRPGPSEDRTDPTVPSAAVSRVRCVLRWDRPSGFVGRASGRRGGRGVCALPGGRAVLPVVRGGRGRLGPRLQRSAWGPGRGPFVWTLGAARAGGATGGRQCALLGLGRRRVVAGARAPQRPQAPVTRSRSRLGGFACRVCWPAL